MAGISARPSCSRSAASTTAFYERDEHEWPLARTQWAKWYLDAESGSMGSRGHRRGRPRGSYPGMGKGLSFRTAPLDRETEITGPLAAKLFVSSASEDMDIFATLRALAPDGSEVTFDSSTGSQGPPCPGLAEGLAQKAGHRTQYRVAPVAHARHVSRSSRRARSTSSTWKSGRPAWSCPPDTHWSC